MFPIWSKSFLLVGNKANVPVTPTIEDFDINGYTGTVTTLLEDSTCVTIYEFNPVLNIMNRWFQGVYDSKPDKVLLIRENNEIVELINGPVSSINMYYNDTLFQVAGSIMQVKFYSRTIEKINITKFSTRIMPPR